MPKAYSSAGTFTRRIGSTNYRVVVHYCPDENENFERKVTRMIRNDLAFLILNLKTASRTAPSVV